MPDQGDHSSICIGAVIKSGAEQGVRSKPVAMKLICGVLTLSPFCVLCYEIPSRTFCEKSAASPKRSA